MSKAKKGDLYIVHTLHVRRGDVKNAKGETEPNTVAIPHGQMVSDTDLTEKEIEEFRQYPGILRAPTFEEIQAMDSAEEQKAASKEARAAESERQRLAADQEFERQQLETEHRTRAETEKAKLADQQAKEREKAAGSGKSKK